MGKAQHLEKYSHVGQNAVHVLVVIGGKNIFTDSFQNEEALFLWKPLRC